MSNCRSCGATIKWIKLASGKQHPCDPDALHANDAEPGMRLVSEDGKIFTVKGESDFEDDYGYVSHFSTCPQANDWRKSK